MRWSSIGVVVGLLVACAPAAAHSGQPTRLRLEARTAEALFSDGRRFAIVESAGRLSILDTFERTRHTLRETGCRVGGIQFGQTQVSAGRALLNCRFGPALLTLSNGTIAPLPARVGLDGVDSPLYYYAVGAHWAVSDAGFCRDEQAESV